MWGKALRNESLDQNNAKDCLQSCGYSGKWTSFLPFRVQLHRMWAIAFRNGTLDRNTGRNVQRSADVSGNARHFCDFELNYTGCESSRIELNHWIQRKDISKFADVLFARILLVELRLTGPTSISWYVRTTFSKSLASYQSNDSALTVRLRILTFEPASSQISS